MDISYPEVSMIKLNDKSRYDFVNRMGANVELFLSTKNFFV